MRRFLVVSLAAAFLMIAASEAGAFQIYVCTGCTAPPGGDPNVINPASINVGSAGNFSAVAPLLILVGVPNVGAAPTLSLPSGVNPAATGTYYGLNFATTGTTSGRLEGTLTSANNGQNDAYTQSGLSGGSNSENWSNWDGYDVAHGVTVGSAFNLFAYGIDFALNSGSGGNSPITIDFTGLTSGSFVIGYNCLESGSTCSGGDVGSTPFTNAGTPAVPMPEPTTLLLLGSGLVGFGLRRYWK